MNIDILWLHAGLVALIVVSAYFMQVKTVRLRARFNLYRVRDRLVLLVADETLDESSHIFTYFYKRINSVLADDRPLGIDDVLHLMFIDMKNGNFDRVIEKAKKELNEIAADPTAKNEQVRSVIADYHRGMNGLLIAHSNLLRVVYQVSHFALGTAMEKMLKPFAPKRIRDGMAAINYAENEANLFSRA